MNAVAPPPTDAAWPSPAVAWRTVAVLMVAYLFAIIDRQILSLLVVPIQADLGLADTDLGLLQGFAFGVFYTLLGIPLGWLVDRAHRRNLLLAGFVLWSLATAAGGFAETFEQLFWARVCVGIGEATLAPAAISLLADSFEPRQRPLAMSVYVAAGSIGGGVALMVGSFALSLAGQWQALAAFAPWQGVFLLVGVAGLLAALLLLLIDEPPRREVGTSPAGNGGWLLPGVVRRLWPALVPHMLGMAVFSVMAYGLLAWIPTYLLREFDWPLARTGLVFGALFATLGPIGAVSGGLLARRAALRCVPQPSIRVAAACVAVAIVPYWLATLVRDPLLAVVLFGIGTLCSAMPSGPSVAALQGVASNEVRGQVVALYYFVLNLLGLGLGPVLVALLTDHVFGTPAAVGRSLAWTVGVLGPLSAWLMWRATVGYRREAAGG